MKDIKRDLRPRDKAMHLGIESLNDEELFCLILGSGTSLSSVQTIARRILEVSDQLSGLFDMQLSQLTAIEGVGNAKALSLMASMELAKRALKARACLDPVPSRADLHAWLQAEYGSAPQEYFVGVYLNTKGKMVSHKVLSLGTLDCSMVHPRDLFREAFKCNASSVVFAHNHPSGDVMPSVADLDTTRNLLEAARISGIRIDDHLIVGRSSCFSFKEHHLLEEGALCSHARSMRRPPVSIPAFQALPQMHGVPSMPAVPDAQNSETARAIDLLEMWAADTEGMEDLEELEDMDDGFSADALAADELDDVCFPAKYKAMKAATDVGRPNASGKADGTGKAYVTRESEDTRKANADKETDGHRKSDTVDAAGTEDGMRSAVGSALDPKTWMQAEGDSREILPADCHGSKSDAASLSGAASASEIASASGTVLESGSLCASVQDGLDEETICQLERPAAWKQRKFLRKFLYGEDLRKGVGQETETDMDAEGIPPYPMFNSSK